MSCIIIDKTCKNRRIKQKIFIINFFIKLDKNDVFARYLCANNFFIKHKIFVNNIVIFTNRCYNKIAI